MSIQAILFDMDDTLLRDDRTISDYTLSVLSRAAGNGIHIIPASGRAMESMKSFVDQIGCCSGYIACNGAEIWSSDHRLLHQEVIDVSLLRECAAFSEEYGVYAQVYKGKYFFYSDEGHWNKAYEQSSMLQGKHVGKLTDFITEPSSKLLMMSDPEQIAVMYREAQKRFSGRVQVTCSKPVFLEINPLKATKGLALRKAADIFRFDHAESAAFGDGLNDLSMLLSAGVGVAVENAWPEVKEKIHRHCLSNQEDGVARYIAEYWLEEVCP